MENNVIYLILSYISIECNKLIKQWTVTMEKFLVSLCPHDGAASHTPEDHRVSTQEICRQSCIQLPTYREQGQSLWERGERGKEQINKREETVDKSEKRKVLEKKF